MKGLKLNHSLMRKNKRPEKGTQSIGKQGIGNKCKSKGTNTIRSCKRGSENISFSEILEGERKEEKERKKKEREVKKK